MRLTKATGKRHSRVLVIGDSMAMLRKQSEKLNPFQLFFDSTGTSATLLGRRGHNEKNVSIYHRLPSSSADAMKSRTKAVKISVS